MFEDKGEVASPTETELNPLERQRFFNIVGVFLTELYQEYGTDFPLWLYSSSAIALYDQEGKVFQKNPEDLDIYTTREGIVRLHEFLTKYKDKFEIKVIKDGQRRELSSFENDVTKSSEKITHSTYEGADYSFNLVAELTYQGSVLKLDIWSGVGAEGKIALEPEQQNETLIQGINIQDHTRSIEFPSGANNGRQMARVFTPEALIEIYQYVKKLQSKHPHLTPKDREEALDGVDQIKN